MQCLHGSHWCVLELSQLKLFWVCGCTCHRAGSVVRLGSSQTHTFRSCWSLSHPVSTFGYTCTTLSAGRDRSSAQSQVPGNDTSTSWTFPSPRPPAHGFLEAFCGNRGRGMPCHGSQHGDHGSQCDACPSHVPTQHSLHLWDQPGG